MTIFEPTPLEVISRLREHIREWGIQSVSRDILWYDGQGKALPPAAAVSGVWNVVVIRSGDDGNAENSFMMNMPRRRWVLELCADPAVHESIRYRARTEGCNTAVIEPDVRRTLEPNDFGMTVRFETNRATTLCMADLSELGQTEGMARWSRENGLDIRTLCISAGDVRTLEYYRFTQADTQIVLEENGQAVSLRKSGREISVELRCMDASLSFTVMEPPAPIPKQSNTPASRIRIAVEFVPQDANKNRG